MALNTWVSDKLVDILGFTDKSIVDYVIAIAKKTTDVPTFVESLKKCDMPMNTKTESFATELLAKIPKGSSSTTKKATKVDDNNNSKRKLSNLKDLVDEEELTKRPKVDEVISKEPSKSTSSAPRPKQIRKKSR